MPATHTPRGRPPRATLLLESLREARKQEDKTQTVLHRSRSVPRRPNVDMRFPATTDYGPPSRNAGEIRSHGPRGFRGRRREGSRQTHSLRSPAAASHREVGAHSQPTFGTPESSSFRSAQLVDKFVGILPEINVPETCVFEVLARLAAFEVELARRDRGRHERRRADPLRR